MTTITFDGRSLAADKQCTQNGMKRTVTKVHRIGELAVACAGDTSRCREMLEWVRRGRIAAEFPSAQRDSATAVEVVVIEDGKILCYDLGPYPVVIDDPVFATGSGSQYALAAMYCGMDARKAVAVACQFDAFSGMGVDAIDLVPA